MKRVSGLRLRHQAGLLWTGPHPAPMFADEPSEDRRLKTMKAKLLTVCALGLALAAAEREDWAAAVEQYEKYLKSQEEE